MKKLYSFFLICFLISGNILFAQLLLPQFKPVQKQTTFSSDEEDSNPILCNDGASIFYNRTYTEKDGQNIIATAQEIWFAAHGKKGWENPYRLLREDDLLGENLIVGTNETGTRIYVFNALPDKDTLYRKLYYLDKAEEKYKWSEPTEVIIPGLKYGNDFIHFYINPEETVILVSKPPQGNSNDEDLFVSVKDEKGNWGPLVDLGKDINTNRVELGSFITKDLKTIYFSSEGHGGYGSADIFVSMRLDDSWQNWTKPLNLGEPVNTIDYEAFFTITNGNEVYFTSDRDDVHSNIYNGTFTGELVLANNDSLKGLFIKKGKPVIGANFLVSDSKGNKVADVTTNNKGVFKFEKLKGEENYLVKMKEEDPDFVGSKIYFLSEKDEKTDRYVYTKEGLFVNSEDLGTNEVFQGVFNYNSLPAIKTGLVVFDENGFPLDTIYTDDKGNFTYTVLDLETGFSLVPLNMTEDDFINVDIYLLDPEGNRLQTLSPRKFHTLTIDDIELVELQIAEKTQAPGIDLEHVEGAQQEITAWEGSAEESKIIYFDFEEVQPNVGEHNKLSLIVSLIRLDSERKIVLTGHTDNSGEESVNFSFGLARAGAVQSYLISKGVPAQNIKVLSEGEKKPKADNSTRKGRVQNRRVEIRVK
ncbi:MAG: outer membrane protein OmpA-like peptidoglycan-associated protein [Vicingaceae bacterium]|jgi:outer membrane protein OmpA-like peptidoglycan-associated protein